MGGWVGAREVEENEAVRMRCWMPGGLGGWWMGCREEDGWVGGLSGYFIQTQVGGWVGGWVRSIPVEEKRP